MNERTESKHNPYDSLPGKLKLTERGKKLAIRAALLATAGVLAVGAKLGLDYQSSPEMEQERYNQAISEFEDNRDYEILRPNDGETLEMTYENGARFRYDPTTTNYGSNIAKVLNTDGETLSVEVDTVIVYTGDIENGYWYGVLPTQLSGTESLGSIADDPEPLRSDNIVWTNAATASTKVVSIEEAN